jgi:hypothetical protein
VARHALVRAEDGEAPLGRRAAAHLTHCAACRQFAATSLPPLQGFREHHPLGAGDLARVRAAVLRRAGAGRRPLVAGALRWSLAGAALALLVAATVVVGGRRPVGPPVVGERPARTPAVSPPRVVAPPPQLIASSPDLPEAAELATGAAGTTSRPVAVAATRGHERPPAVDAAPPQREGAGVPAAEWVAADDAPALRIELRTADPDVRIIWLANHRYRPERASAREEAP